jgi:hypothetical protein
LDLTGIILCWRRGFNFLAVAHNRTALRTLRLAWRAKAAADQTQAPAKQRFRLKNSLASALLKGNGNESVTSRLVRQTPESLEAGVGKSTGCSPSVRA